MGGAGWFNLIPQLPDFAGAGLNWALGNMANNRYKESVRHLRRREYQDMVFSLKQAGLNPALAYGASPGHASGFAQQVQANAGSAGIANAMAQLEQAGTAAKVAPSQIGLNEANAALKGEERFNTMLGRAGLLQAYEKDAAWIEQTLQSARTSAAQEELFKAQALREGASKAELEERTSQYNRWGLPGQNWEGGIRALIQEFLDSGSTTGLLPGVPNSSKDAQTFESWLRERYGDKKDFNPADALEQFHKERKR